ncbi:septum formation family protein [Corynebacterium pacaense]|uniref:septum formation family protein n=1 Tax=Corynebacterium pacaense TaxID=1816684 RepID=UPI001FEAE165|nr:septum formation family protein [Corynebacterium pacaense]
MSTGTENPNTGHPRGARSAFAVRTMLVAALAGTAAVGAYSYSINQNSPEGRVAQPVTQASSPTTTQVASFTTADVGACATWDVNDDGQVSGFDQVSCDQEHRFEISAREDLAAYPSSEFGPSAAPPNLTRQAQLREELCQAPTLAYLDGRFDPAGRYTIAPILPSAEAWAAGDRTMLCGLQATDSNGTPQLTVGPISANDQSRVFAIGACIRVESSAEFREVDCAGDHHLEAVSTVNLAVPFPNGVPSTEEQNSFLGNTCTQAAIDYLGGEENLYQSTLQTFWPTLTANSWVGGSNSVNCYLMSPSTGGNATFNSLQGSARGAFTINGTPPPPQPEREPLRSSAGATP